MTHHNIVHDCTHTFPAAKNKIPWLAIAEALILVGGIVLIVGSCFLNWVSYTNVSDGATYVEYLKGLDFGKKVSPQYLEVYLIPILGAVAVIAALFSAGRRRSDNSIELKTISTALRVFVLIMGIVALILTVEIAYRFNPTMTDSTGLTFWENAKMGWYATIYGSLLVIFGASMSFGKQLRKIGFMDYWLVRETKKDEMSQQTGTAATAQTTASIASPPYLHAPTPPHRPPMAAPVGMAAPPPPPPPVVEPCPTCGKPLDYIPEYQAHYCYNCKKYP